MNQEKTQPASPEAIGPYAILDSLGKGGMGEVYLARDPVCGRRLAVKRIRPDLKENNTILQRFLREAKVASQLTHPSIVPILEIRNTPPEIYYTMPYVEGETLRQILRASSEADKTGASCHLIGRSIPALARIFLQVCEAIAYTHSKGILHRDLKPENIIVGKYGEVMILDWGIADFISELNRESEDETLPERLKDEIDLTRPGKIAGTLAYLAPERLTGAPSSVQADIYALGVILYYMLTLQLPFQRKTIAAFRKQAASERYVEPTEMSPYRDIPHQLSAVCRKCLAYSPKERFGSVEELIAEIKSYIEGHARWIHMGSLHPSRKPDWQFQENILLAKHIAISRNLDESEWAALMISKKSFASNVKLEARVKLSKESHGIGFLLSIPPVEDRKMLEEGYCLWLSPSDACLFRNNVQVFRASKGLSHDEWQHVRIEKVDDHLTLYLNGKLAISYASHLPLAGAHVGFLHKDAAFEIESIEVFDVSNSATVRCLAIPNALLSHKLYDLALQEYRRIGQSFPGRQEGRDAQFRAGVALLEKGKSQRTKQAKEQICQLALQEFEELYRTPGAPLEYLGKSLVYEALDDAEEEAKCLELALRKYPKHPLLPILKEHIVYRMHESSQTNRQAAFRIILLSIRHMPDVLENPDTRSLIASLQRNLETLPFLEKAPPEDFLSDIAIQLAFWLAKPPILGEIASQLAERKTPPTALIENALFCLLELEAKKELQKQLQILPDAAFVPNGKKSFQSALAGKLLPFNYSISRREARFVCFTLKNALAKRSFAQADEIIAAVQKCHWPLEDRVPLHALMAWARLIRRDTKGATAILRRYGGEELNAENSPLHFAYGCWLHATKGPEVARNHFSNVLDTPHPWTTALPSHFLLGRIDGKKGWIEGAFWWEKKELHRQLDFFYHAIGKNK